MFINRPSVYKQISPNLFPSFPKDPSPYGPARFGKLGNGKRYMFRNFPNFPNDPSPSDPLLFGTFGNGYRYILPNFPNNPSPDGPAQFWKLGNGSRYILPISQKTPAQMGQHFLGNWEMSTGTCFPISQFPKRSQPIWLSTIWEIGKLGNEYRYQVHLPNFPISQKTRAQMAQHYLGNWEMSTGTCFPISQKISAHLAQHYLGN